MADFAEGITTESPHELTLAQDCQQWRTLPEPGGMFDQPLRVMVEMKAALNVYAAFKARASADNAEVFSKQHPAVVEFCFEVDKMR